MHFVGLYCMTRKDTLYTYLYWYGIGCF